MKTIAIAYFIALTSFAGYAQNVDNRSADLNKINDTVDAFINKRMNDFSIPGLTLAVLMDGEIVKLGTYGVANLETNTPVTPESVFMICSLTKQFIAYAIVLLQQEGKLSIDDKMTKYISETPDAWKDITIKHLLIHTSGIKRDPSDYHPYAEQPVTEVIKSMFNEPLVSQPGEKWLYSNVGYYILAEIISRVSGQPWDKFINGRILVPAGMSNTRITSAKEIIANRVSGYHNTDTGRINAENWIAVRPSGGFLSTIQDMVKWEKFVDKHELLSDSSGKLLFKTNLLNNNETVEYGMGWYVHKYLGRTRIHHDGQFPGFRADYERFTDDKLTVIVLANSDNRGLESISVKTAGFYDPDLATPVFKIESVKDKISAIQGSEMFIEIRAGSLDKNADNCIVEIEIRDESGKPVFKQQKYNEDFLVSDIKKLIFNWTPDKKGNYTINLGIFGSGWNPEFAWKVNLATITVK